MSSFKVGDRVKVISMRSWYAHKLPLGMIVTLVKYNSLDKMWAVRGHVLGNAGFHDDCFQKLVTLTRDNVTCKLP